MVVITNDALNILFTSSTTVNRAEPRLLILKQSFLPRFITVENSGKTLFWSVWTPPYISCILPAIENHVGTKLYSSDNTDGKAVKKIEKPVNVTKIEKSKIQVSTKVGHKLYVPEISDLDTNVLTPPL